MRELNFEEFIEYTWDYVSEIVVSDKFWNENKELIQEMTYNLYRLYEKNVIKDSNNKIVLEKITPKMCGKILESFFSTLGKFEIKR